MFSKLYESLKRYIKKNYKFLLILIATYVVFTFPLPYYIYTTGGTIDINDRVELENATSSKGSFNLAYVSEIRGTIPTFLLSYLVPTWERVKAEDTKLNPNESLEEVAWRDHLALEEANQSAIQVAYRLANKKFSVTKRHHYVVYVSEDSDTDLLVGDEIISVDGQKIENLEEYRAIIKDRAFEEKIPLRIMREKQEKEAFVTVKQITGQKLTGISLTTIYDYETDPALKLHFSKNESGPSGGLMLTLSIYNKLIPADITHGKKIVGTGTIDEEGVVGAIGGVRYKLAGAVKEKADIFFVPKGENYEECVKLQKERKYDIEIVGVATIEEAVAYLNGL